MKKTIVVLTVLALVLSCFVSCAKKDAGKAEGAYSPANEDSKFWYVMGQDLISYYGDYYKSYYSDFDLEAFVNGAMDYVNGTFPYSDEEVNQIATDYQNRLAEKEASDAQANLDKAEAFLNENAKKDGVKVTDSGLQYKVIKEGNGVRPKADDTVEVHYVFTLSDGTLVQDSHDSGSTATLSLSNVIKGFAEGVQLMDVGSTYMFYIHPDLGYGSTAVSAEIPGNSVLVYEVELVSIVE